MFKFVGFFDVEISNDPLVVEGAEKIVLPGVGAFDSAMKKINGNFNLKKVVESKVFKSKVPILGICLGMQILTNSSEEGLTAGLGWIPGQVTRFSNSVSLKVPHMGWNKLEIMRECVLTKNVTSEFRFYFAHSYFVKVKNAEDSISQTSYGLNFDSIIQRDNIFGVQFHPEKSHRFGAQIFKNFIAI